MEEDDPFKKFIVSLLKKMLSNTRRALDDPIAYLLRKVPTPPSKTTATMTAMTRVEFRTHHTPVS
jgi:hypothetical protein